MNTVEYQVSNRVASIVLNRPEKRNALNPELVNELKNCLSAAEEDMQCKVIVLKAKGDTFCAGADLAYLQQLQKFSYDENLADSNSLKDLFLKIYNLKKVVIAQVEGHALAGGCGLTTVCDFCFSVPEAQFGYTEVRIGFLPALVMVFLIRKLGDQKARHLLLSGELINAEAALRIGLISRVVAREKMQEEVGQFAQQLIMSNSGNSLELTKKMLSEVQSLSLQEALDFAAHMNAEARSSADCVKGIRAFLEKNPVKW